MTAETDEQFLDGAEYAYGHHMVPQHRARLFALARRGAEAAARIERLEAALREIMGMDEVAIVEFKKGDGWLHQRVARAALGEEKKG